MLMALFFAAWAQAGGAEIVILGGRNQEVFLGCLSCGQYHPDSIWNGSSRYGWSNDYGVWTSSGPYRSPYGPESACNASASTPPVLVDRNGGSHGTLSVNEYAPRSVCAAPGSSHVCRALRVMCARR